MNGTFIENRNQLDAEAALVARGVNEQLAAWVAYWVEEGTIERTIAWYDAQQGRVGPGVLVSELRRGGPAAPRLDDQRAYGESIAAWIRAKLPDLCDERGRPHYAAIAAVIRLHYRFGKGALTVKAHGAEIREAVKAAKQDSEEAES